MNPRLLPKACFYIFPSVFRYRQNIVLRWVLRNTNLVSSALAARWRLTKTIVMEHIFSTSSALTTISTNLNLPPLTTFLSFSPHPFTLFPALYFYLSHCINRWKRQPFRLCSALVNKAAFRTAMVTHSLDFTVSESRGRQHALLHLLAPSPLPPLDNALPQLFLVLYLFVQ